MWVLCLMKQAFGQAPEHDPHSSTILAGKNAGVREALVGVGTNHPPSASDAAIKMAQTLGRPLTTGSSWASSHHHVQGRDACRAVT